MSAASQRARNRQTSIYLAAHEKYMKAALDFGRFHRDHVAEQGLDVVRVHHLPDRTGDVGRLERRCGNLVQERLEQMMIRTIQEGYAHGSMLERLCCR